MLTETEIREMKYNDLRKYAKRIGIKVPKRIKKAEMQLMVLEVIQPKSTPEPEGNKKYEDYKAWCEIQGRTILEIRAEAERRGIDFQEYSSWRRKQKRKV